MTYRTVLLILLTVSLLTNCQSASPVPNETPTLSTSIVTLSEASLTPVKTSLPTTTPTVTPSYSFHLDSQCPALSDALLNGVAKGTISYHGRKMDYSVLLNLETGIKSTLPSEGELGKARVSPDRNRISYRDTDPNTLKHFLVVQVLDEHKTLKRAWLSPTVDLSRWLDDERLLFTDYENEPPYSHIVYNPFTEETVVLVPDYPNITHKDINWERAGSAIYDQTLDYVMYAAWDEAQNEHYYLLWHIPSQTKLAALPGNSYGGYTYDYTGLIFQDGVTFNPPVWSSDDTRVAVISSSPHNSKVDEIFAITKDGNIQQLTDFSSQYQEVNLRTLSWSPHGEQIAFFITTEFNVDNATRNEQLAILDTRSGAVSFYCLEGDIIGTPGGMFFGDETRVPAPLWSPDGTQVIIENRFESDESRLILLDIPSNTAYVLGKNMQPYGWMSSEPK